MSPNTKVSREQWIDAGVGLLENGRDPGAESLNGLGEILGVTKGSFYAWFPGGLAELHGEIIARWRQETTAALTIALQDVRDPADRLRQLWGRLTRNTAREDAMRRWAAHDAAAAAAVASLDGEIIKEADEALRNLGFPAAEAAVLAAVLASAAAGAHRVQARKRRRLTLTQPGAFDTLLTVLTRAALMQVMPGGEQEIEAVPGAAPDEVILFTIAKDLPAAARRDLAVRAQRFAREAEAEGQLPARRSARRRAGG